MNYEKAMRELGPCGIDCSRCVSYAQGNVVRLSQQLKESLVNFEHMASRLKSFVPVFNDYEQFLAVLEHFSKGTCTGCRSGESTSCYAACAAKSCYKTQKVDFCFQCRQYPCNENSYPEALYKKWKDNNDKMKNDGVEAFYHEQKKKPRY
ncbi:MAG: DUF3795 domain-containing protein [Bacillota bacterium]